MAAEQGVPVDLYIYDLTNGLASLLSPAILDTKEHPLVIGKEVESERELGRQVEGVWHTAVVVYEREYFYGAGGVTSCAPGGTQLGAPHAVERLGDTFVPFAVLVDYMQGLATTTYTGAAYRLLEHNCNHFSDEVAQFLCGARVPKHILAQPEQLPPPLRLALSALLDNLVPGAPQAVYADGVRHARAESPDYVTLNHQIEQAREVGAALEQRRSTLAEKLARKERRREKRRSKHAPPAPDIHEMAEAVEAAPLEVAGAAAGPSCSLAPDLDERREQEQRRRDLDPPIVYRDIDAAAEFEALSAALADAALSEEHRQSLDELRQYLVLGEGSWVLGDDFLGFIGHVLSADELAGARRAAWRCLAAGALRDDISLLLHQDRRTHALLSHAHRIDTLPPPEQHALALFMCNLFENISSSEWLLYISEWECAGQPLSNIRATTKVCVHATLSEDLELRELGTALMYNVATKERFSMGKALRDLLPPRAKSKKTTKPVKEPSTGSCSPFHATAEPTTKEDSQEEETSDKATQDGKLQSFPSYCRADDEDDSQEAGSDDLATPGRRETEDSKTKDSEDPQNKNGGCYGYVFDEVSVELAMALLQLLAWAPGEAHLFRALRSLARLAQHSADVPQLVAMLGPEPAAFRGTSARVDEQIDQLMKKLK